MIRKTVSIAFLAHGIFAFQPRPLYRKHLKSNHWVGNESRFPSLFISQLSQNEKAPFEYDHNEESFFTFKQEDFFTPTSADDIDVRGHASRLHTLILNAHELLQQINDEVETTRSMLLSAMENNEEEVPKIDVANSHEYNEALQNARDVDNTFGLCSQESEDAWRRVDEIYDKQMEMSRCLERKIEAMADLNEFCSSLQMAVNDFDNKQLLSKISLIEELKDNDACHLQHP